MPNYVLDLMVNRVDLVDEGANSDAYIKLFKRKEQKHMTFQEIIAGLKPEHAEVVKAALTEQETKVADLTAEVAKAKEELATVKKAQEDVKKSKVTTEDVIKGLDPQVQEIFKSIQAQKEAAETIAKQLSDEKIEKAAIARAEELKNIPVETEKLVAVAKSASDEVFEVLKAASNAIDADLLKSKGSSNTGSGEGTVDAWSLIEKKAEALATEQNITKAKAITQVITSDTALYEQYLKEAK